MFSHDFRFVPSPIFKIDSRIVSVKMTVNPNPTGDLTQDFSNCTVDPIAMKYNPVRIRYEQDLFEQVSRPVEQVPLVYKIIGKQF